MSNDWHFVFVFFWNNDWFLESNIAAVKIWPIDDFCEWMTCPQMQPVRTWPSSNIARTSRAVALRGRWTDFMTGATTEPLWQRKVFHPPIAFTENLIVRPLNKGGVILWSTRDDSWQEKPTWARTAALQSSPQGTSGLTWSMPQVFFYLFHNCIKQKWNIKHPMIKCQRWLCSSSSPQYSTQGDKNLIF